MMQPRRYEQMTLAELHHRSRASRRYFHDLQRWAQEEAEPERSRLAADLDSAKDDQVWSAAQELYLGHIFRVHGWPYDRHPKLPHISTKPDFLVRHSTGDFYVEAAIIMDSTWQQTQSKMHRAIMVALESVTGPFDGIITVMNGHIPGSFSRRKVRQWVQRRIDQLAASGSPQQYEFTYQPTNDPSNFTIRFTLVPSSDAGRVVWADMTTGPIAVAVNTDAAIRGTAHDKLARYGKMDNPFLLALQLRTDFPPTTASIHNALLGTRYWSKSRETGTIELGRHNDGIFTTFEDGRPIRTRLSGILFYHEAIQPGDDETRHEMVLFHNRWAQHPLSIEVFSNIPQLVPESIGATTYTHRWLGAPPRWAT